jgi:hypothetical protein
MRAAIAAALVVLATVQPAQALTIRDVIELTRAGLTDEVLVALIEVDGGVYATDTATLKSLKEAGVSERVMVALIRSGRERRVEEPLPAPVVEDVQQQTPPPPTIVIEHREVIEHRGPEVQQVAVPVYVPVYQTRGRSHSRQDFNGIQPSTFVPFQSAPPLVTPRPNPEPSSPVYWGFGGKRRPDAWDPPPNHHRKPSDDGENNKDRDRGDRNRPPTKK